MHQMDLTFLVPSSPILILQWATPRDDRIISISAFMPANPDEQVEGIISIMLKNMRVVAK